MNNARHAASHLHKGLATPIRKTNRKPRPETKKVVARALDDSSRCQTDDQRRRCRYATVGATRYRNHFNVLSSRSWSAMNIYLVTAVLLILQQ
ncbi:hypothetical protein GWI33_000441 [Rhynchophorus ferrugineus]|uniref:Uncharacterized protein n=1 Tax=Rhynchophorus ferrugineus TaxID=354439 RepID=A0A834HM72_RHYFE|nr:hypothetical protein GWI33_000441 [Rhynchophorus ferrugineus]